MTPQAFVKRPVEWLRAISRHRGTISFAPNFAYDLAVRRVKDSRSSRVSICRPGASPDAAPSRFTPPTLAAFAEKFRPAGFRETSFCRATASPSTCSPRRCRRAGARLRVERLVADDVTRRRVATHASGQPTASRSRWSSCGPPLARPRGPDRRRARPAPCPSARIGEIAPGRAVGHARLLQGCASSRPGPSATDGCFTGDLGYLSNGELFVCGRVKDIIIVNGRKYHPQDLEWGVDDLAGVRRGRVVAFGTTSADSPIARWSSSSRAARCRRPC